MCLQLRLYDEIDTHDLPLCLGTTNELQILAVEGLYKEAGLWIDNAAQLLGQGDLFGYHVLVWCSTFGHCEMSLWLLSLLDHLEMKVMESALAVAASKGHVEIARHLIESGTNTKGANGNSMLIMAAQNNHTAVVKLLLGENVDALLQNKHGWTPLHYATEASNLEMVEALCKAGAEPVERSQSWRGQTPLHIAAKIDAAASIKAMFKYAPQLNINAIDATGDTALHYAASHDAYNAAATLIELGCNADVTNLDGKTALFLAADHGCLKTAQLLNKGVDVRLKCATDGQLFMLQQKMAGQGFYKP